MDGEATAAGRPGWPTWLGAAALYLAAAIAATWPMAAHLGDSVPGSATDMLQHLRTMRWYKHCLLHGQSPLVCPELQYPVGAELGHFSPTTLQGALFVGLSAVVPDDLVALNLLWLLGFVLTGLGTMALAWRVVGHAGCAWLAGLLAMLSGPMLLHSGGHLELIYVGAFPLSLLAWLAFVDAPTPRRLGLAVGSFLLLSASSPYFAVLGVFPAAWYVAWSAFRQGRCAAAGWIRGRLGWLAAFSALVLVGLVPIFAGQIAAMLHGDPMTRPRAEFDSYGAPLWGYLVPTVQHRLSALLPVADVYKEAGMAGSMAERASYPGVVVLGLLAYAALHRVRVPRAAFWWTTLGLLVILSCGSAWNIGGYRVPLPASWLYRGFFAFKVIRVPARFNLFVGVVAAVLAAAGLRHGLGRLRRPTTRAAVVAALALLALADLSTRPYPVWGMPPLPDAYRFVFDRRPDAAVLEAPEALSSGSYLNSICGYWQTLHGGRTTAGYTAHANTTLDRRLFWNSPFSVIELSNPDYLKNPTCQDFGVMTQLALNDYAWAFLTFHQIDHVVLHRWPGSSWELPVHLDRLRAALEPAKSFEDERAAVYDREKLARPAKPVAFGDETWRPAWDGRLKRAIGRRARLVVYNPRAEKDLRLAIDARSFRAGRVVRLRDEGGRELACWRFEPGGSQLMLSAPFRLPVGFRSLTLESDGAARPAHRAEELLAGDREPISLVVGGVNLAEAPPVVAEAGGAVAR